MKENLFAYQICDPIEISLNDRVFKKLYHYLADAPINSDLSASELEANAREQLYALKGFIKYFNNLIDEIINHLSNCNTEDSSKYEHLLFKYIKADIDLYKNNMFFMSVGKILSNPRKAFEAINKELKKSYKKVSNNLISDFREKEKNKYSNLPDEFKKEAVKFIHNLHFDFNNDGNLSEDMRNVIKPLLEFAIVDLEIGKNKQVENKQITKSPSPDKLTFADLLEDSYKEHADTILSFLKPEHLDFVDHHNNFQKKYTAIIFHDVLLKHNVIKKRNKEKFKTLISNTFSNMSKNSTNSFKGTKVEHEELYTKTDKLVSNFIAKITKH